MGSPTKVSVFGSNFSGRFSCRQMLAIWQVELARWAPSAGAMGVRQLFTQSRGRGISQAHEATSCGPYDDEHHEADGCRATVFVVVGDSVTCHARSLSFTGFCSQASDGSVYRGDENTVIGQGHAV